MRFKGFILLRTDTEATETKTMLYNFYGKEKNNIFYAGHFPIITSDEAWRSSENVLLPYESASDYF